MGDCRRLFGLCHLGRNPNDQTQRQCRRLFSGKSKFAVVGGRAFGDGDAAFGDNFGRNDRTGVFGRNAFYSILLRIAAGDGDFVYYSGSVFLSRKSLYGLWANRGIDITEEDIDEIRREMWGNFPREDI